MERKILFNFALVAAAIFMVCNISYGMGKKPPKTTQGEEAGVSEIIPEGTTNRPSEEINLLPEQSQETNVVASAPVELAKDKPTRTRQIQAALKNAGYDPGPVDGKMGVMTISAIRNFQKANNLTADGKVGQKTWGLLQKYYAGE